LHVKRRVYDVVGRPGRREHILPSTGGGRRPPGTRSDLITRYTIVLLAALSAIVHLAVAPAVPLAGVHPNVVVVAVVLATSLGGLAAGMAWAFSAGTILTLLSGEPLGASPLALLGVAAAVTAGGRLVGRQLWMLPAAAAVIASLVYEGAVLGVTELVGGGLTISDPQVLMLHAGAYNAVLTLCALVPARIVARRAVDHKPSW
jgi:hypothetical protein